MSKVVADAREALSKVDLRDGMTIMAGGFGLCGIPENLIAALRDSGIKNLTVISNNAGVDDFGLGLLLQTRQIRKMISTYVGENAIFEQQYLKGELEIEFVPQGTFAERIRAGGAGIPAFFTPTGAGTVVAEGKEQRTFHVAGKDRLCVLETALTADFAFVRARRGDPYGNLQFKGTTKNFQVAMAMAGRVTIAEVDELVPLGAIAPEDVHLPGIFVRRLFAAPSHRDPIEFRTTRPRS